MLTNDERHLKNYINHLIEILKKMKPQDAGWVLRELALDISFDRELLKIICSSFYNPKYLQTEISDDDLRFIIKRLPKEIVFYLYENFNEYRNLINNEYDSKKLFLSKKSIDEKYVVQYLISTVLELYEKKLISYDGILLLFYITKCNPGKIGNTEGKIFLIKRNYSPGELIWIFLSSTKYAGRKAKIVFEYSDLKTAPYFEINIDFSGEYWGWLPIENIHGSALLTLYVNSEIIAQERIQITKESPSLLSIEEFVLAKSENIFIGNGFLKHKNKKIKDGTKVRYSVYCDICSSPIYFNFFEIYDHKFTLKIEIPLFSEHSYNRFRIFIWLDSDSIFFLASPVSFNEDQLDFQILETRESGQKVSILADLIYGQRYYLFISRDKKFHLDILNSFYGEWGLDFWSEMNQKLSGFELSIEKEELKLFSEINKRFRVISLFYSDLGGKIEIVPEESENISDLYISLYKYDKDWLQIGYYFAPIKEGFQFHLELNTYSEGEESKTVLYNNDEKVKISVLSPRPAKKDRFHTTLYLKYNELVELNYLGKTQKIIPEYNKFYFYKYTFNKENRDEELEILKEIEDKIWKSKIFNPELIIFRMYLINKYSVDIQYKKKYFKSSISLIKEFKDSNNKYYTTKTKDRGIYTEIVEHILLRLFESIYDQDLEVLLLNSFPEFDKKQKNRQSNLEIELIKNTYKYIHEDSGEIRILQEEFTLYELLILLSSIHIRYNEEMFKILMKRKNYKKKIDSNGLRNILEKLGIVSPRNNSYTKIYLKKFGIKQIFELLNDGYYPVKIRDYIQTYFFIQDQMKRRYLYPSRVMENLEQFQTSTSIKLNKYKFRLGEFGSIILDRLKRQTDIFLEFPGFLKVIKNSEIYELDNRILIERENETFQIQFQATSIGRGYIHFIEVDNPGKVSQYKLGLIESTYQ